MDTCNIVGEVIEMPGNGIICVHIPQSDACGSCGGKMLCHMGKNGRTVKIHTEKQFNIGENVNVSMPSSSLLAITFMLYAAGLLAGLAISAITNYFFTETVAAVCFLMVVFVWIPIVGVTLGKYATSKTSVSSIDINS